MSQAPRTNLANSELPESSDMLCVAIGGMPAEQGRPCRFCLGKLFKRRQLSLGSPGGSDNGDFQPSLCPASAVLTRFGRVDVPRIPPVIRRFSALRRPLSILGKPV
jgi:hypothetical protein